MWRPTGEGVVEDSAGSVPVGLGSHGLRGRLLGRHIAHGTDHVRVALRVFVEVRDQAEVEQYEAAGARDENVRRLDVAVDLASFVQRQEAQYELPEGLAQPRKIAGPGCSIGRPGVVAARRLRHRATHVLEKVDAIEQLHGEEPAPSVLEEVIEPDQVRVAQIRERPELALEAHERLGRQRADGLDRHALRQRQVDRFVNDAHAPFTEPPHDLEAAGPAEVLLPHRDR